MWILRTIPRKQDEADIRFLIRRGLPATALYNWRKRSDVQDPISLDLAHQIDAVEHVAKIISNRSCYDHSYVAHLVSPQRAAVRLKHVNPSDHRTPAQTTHAF